MPLLSIFFRVSLLTTDLTNHMSPPSHSPMSANANFIKHRKHFASSSQQMNELADLRRLEKKKSRSEAADGLQQNERITKSQNQQNQPLHELSVHIVQNYAYGFFI